jgi:mannose-6-phosphate isomerase-like protein (cupin superfamily)
MANFTDRPWGGYEILANGNNYTIKILTFTGGGIRWQAHEHRDEYWTVLSGSIFLETGTIPQVVSSKVALLPGHTAHIAQLEWHRASGNGEVLEIWMGDERDDLRETDLLLWDDDKQSIERVIG